MAALVDIDIAEESAISFPFFHFVYKKVRQNYKMRKKEWAPNCLLGIIGLLLVMATLPNVGALTPTNVYNCSDGYLLTNVSGEFNGVYRELIFRNTTCPYGCADNEIECNDPKNIDHGSVVFNAAIFVVIAIIFLFLSFTLKITKGRFYYIKYMFLAMTFIYMLLSVGLLGSMYIFGQDNISSIVWSGWFILAMSFIFTFALFFVTELQEYVKSLLRAGKW